MFDVTNCIDKYKGYISVLYDDEKTALQVKIFLGKNFFL